jgi:hypothetical protein
MTRPFKAFVAATLFLTGFLPTAALAEPPFPLPKEAFDACVDKSEGDPCTAHVRGTEFHGVCARVPERGLFCRPEGPPPEAR